MRPLVTSVRMLRSPLIVTYQAMKPCERLGIDTPERSAHQRGMPMAQAGDGLGHPCGYTGYAQHPNALLDVVDLVRNASAAKQEAVSPVFDRLLRVKRQGIDYGWIPGLKIGHGQWRLIRPHELFGEPHRRSHCRIPLWSAHRWRHDGKALRDKRRLGKRRRPDAEHRHTHEQ